MEMGSGPYGFVTSGISEPGFDYWGFASTSPLRADCRGLETFPMSPVDLGCQFHVGNLAAMASSTCSMKCSNEPSRTLRVSLQKQHWVVPVEYLQQIFMGFGDLEATHVSGQFPLEVLIQYNSIESAVAARYGCDGLYLDDNCCLVVKFSNQQIGRSPLQLQAEEIDGLRQGLEAMSSLINDFQSSLFSLRREINSDYESLLMRVKLGMGVAASLQAADANLGGVDLEENELHSDVTFKNDGVKEPTLGMKDLEASFPVMVNQFEAQMPVEMRSKSPGKNSVVEVKCIVWKPPMCLLKFQDDSYAQYATSECHLLLGNDSSTEGKDQQLRNSNDWFKAWNGELTFYKCIHDFSSAISGNPNNCDNMFIFGSILMNRKPEMYVPKEVGYPPPYGSIVASNKLMLRSKDYLRGGEFRGLGNMFLNKLVDTMSWKWIYVLFRLLVFNTLDSLDEYAIWWNFDLEMKLLMFHLPISAYGRPVPKLFIGSMTILSASLASLINVADIASNDVRLFSYNSLRSATMDLHPSNKIGGGGFGVVCRGVLRDNTDVAVKCLSAESKQGTNEFLTEINMISTIRHPNLVELIGCCVEGTNRILVYEYLENNSLANALLGSKDKRVSLDWPSRAAICTGTAAGLTFLHEEAEPPIVHRDIKASNVLLDANFHPKIGDFGLAKLFPDNVTHVSTQVAGTIGYLAPEYAMLGQLTKKADVYSFGVLLLEIISGRSNSKTAYGHDLLVLLEWTWKLKAQDRLLEIVDPDLTGYPEQEVMRFIKVALFCTQASSHLRPGMKQVVEMLSRDVNLNESLLTELMVRIQVAQTVVLSAFS